MSDVKMSIDVSLSATLHLDEEQVRALDAIVGYGPEPFIKGFKKQLGEAYIRPYEDGVRSLFEAVRLQVRPAIHHAEKARKALVDAKTEHMKYDVNIYGKRRKDCL